MWRWDRPLSPPTRVHNESNTRIECEIGDDCRGASARLRDDWKGAGHAKDPSGQGKGGKRTCLVEEIAGNEHLSGLRKQEQERNYIQTTAPISPGSSGGGLFDNRGNLVGITTLVLAGRERLNQSLNFAIPAATFFDE